MKTKKLMALVLVLALLVVALAYADAQYGATLQRGTGKYVDEGKEKTSSTGSKAVFDIISKTANASMYYQIRKTDGVGASKELITSGTGTYRVSYMLDGNGNSLGLYMDTYKIRVAHRSQSSVSGEANVQFNAAP